ncbi:MAG: CPBP family intramembrane metalloprotease [Candidatus Marinimicrobia bacterium]|nr:CPBP family intramembrane metalloprotease [Candidatus Neomarinimicrobiota bacterium]
MRKISFSYKVYIGLVLLLSCLAALNIFLPQGDFLPPDVEQSMPASQPIMALANAGIMLILYGGLGWIGLVLGHKVGFPDVMDSTVSAKQRFLIPALAGIGVGLFFIGSDLILRNFHSLGPLPHPPFPTSLVASTIAGIGEELIFRLFFVSFWFWLIYKIILKQKWETTVFWMIVFLSAIAFSAGHLPSAMILLGADNPTDLPVPILIEIFLLNGTLSILAAYYLRKYGYLAAVGIHFWTDIIWHVIWGLF